MALRVAMHPLPCRRFERRHGWCGQQRFGTGKRGRTHTWVGDIHGVTGNFTGAAGENLRGGGGEFDPRHESEKGMDRASGVFFWPYILGQGRAFLGFDHENYERISHGN